MASIAISCHADSDDYLGFELKDNYIKKVKKMRKIKDKKEIVKKDALKRLQEAKEEHKKSNFSEEDRKRIEKILYNK